MTEHGIAASYWAGCRCRDCRRAMRDRHDDDEIVRALSRHAVIELGTRQLQEAIAEAVGHRVEVLL